MEFLGEPRPGTRPIQGSRQSKHRASHLSAEQTNSPQESSQTAGLAHAALGLAGDPAGILGKGAGADVGGWEGGYRGPASWETG